MSDNMYFFFVIFSILQPSDQLKRFSSLVLCVSERQRQAYPLELIQGVRGIDVQPEVVLSTIVHIQSDHPEARSDDRGVECAAKDALTCVRGQTQLNPILCQHFVQPRDILRSNTGRGVHIARSFGIMDVAEQGARESLTYQLRDCPRRSRRRW